MPEARQKIIVCPNGHYYDAGKHAACPFCSGQGQPVRPPEIMVDPPLPDIHPPGPAVGWLVAVDGPNMGADYRIHPGDNHIGSKRGDIRIQDDRYIADEKDSIISFVPQTGQFSIAYERGKNVLLVNDVPVTGGSAELHDRDRITVGNTNLVLVALRGEAFTWLSTPR